MAGKLGSSGAFSTAYVYTAELFPTPVRGTAVGACSTVGRVGSAAAPQLALFLPTVTFDALPLVKRNKKTNFVLFLFLSFT